VLDLDADDSSGQIGANYSTNFVESGGPVVIVDADATLGDVDSPNLQSLTVTITNLQDGVAESLAVDTLGTSISSSYDSGTGVLTLSGSDTVANYQMALRTVSYNNISSTPDGTPRSISIVANDGFADSNVAFSTITINGQNQPPVVDLDPDNSSGAGTPTSALDQFSSSTYSGDDGTHSWASDWTETNDDGLAGSGNIRIDGGRLRLDNLDYGSYESIARSIDLSGVSRAQLSFDYDGFGGGSVLDRYAIEVSSDGGANYTVLEIADVVGNENGTKSFDLEAYVSLTADMSIRFRLVQGFGSSGDYIALDNVQVAFETGSDFVNNFTEDGGAVAVADSDASITDLDSTQLQSLTVTITNVLDGAAESLSADTTGTSIAASYDSGTGVLTLTGTDTVANYEQVLRTIEYDNTSQDPDTTDRVLEVVTNDGTADSNIGTTTIAMTADNDAPVLDLDANDSSGSSGADFSTTFTEDGGAVTIADVDATFIDVDSSTLTSMTVTLTNRPNGGQESLSADTTGTSMSASYNSGSGVLTLTGVDSIANYETVLRRIEYDNASNNPDTTDRTITFVANDGEDDSNIGTATVVINPTNDAPVLDLDADDSSGATGADYDTTFTEDGGAVNIADVDASIGDVDDTNLESLTITITNLLDGAAESLSADTTGTSIAASYDSGTGVLTLTGTDTVANYEQVLRTIEYDNTSQDPNTTDRVLEVVTNDGTADSNIGTTTIAMTADNDAPLNSVPGTQSTNEDTPLIFSAAGGNAISVSDVDAADLEVALTADRGTITLASTAGLAFSTGDGSDDATMTFSGSQSSINAALEGLVFDPIADYYGPARVTVSASDLGATGAGGVLADVDVIDINVVPINDAPINSMPVSEATNEDTPLVFSAANGNSITVSDVDAGASTMTVTLAATNGTLTLGGTTGLVFTNGDGIDDTSMTFDGSAADVNTALDGLTYEPDANYHGNATVQLSVNDNGNFGAGGSLSDADVVNITVASVNDAPTSGSDDYTLQQASELVIDPDGVLANDGDVDGTLLNAVLVSGPTHGMLMLNADGSFTYVPDPTFHGTDSFTYQASDGAANSGDTTVVLTVEPLPPPADDGGDAEEPSEDDSSDDEKADDDIGIIGDDRGDDDEDSRDDEEIMFSRDVRRAQGKGLDQVVSQVNETAANMQSELRTVSLRSYSGEVIAELPLATRTFDEVPAPNVTTLVDALPVLSSELLWNQLDELAEQLEQSTMFGSLTVGSVAGTSMALVAGYVLWTLRGSYLVASLLASTPLWSMMDPLPMLEFADSEDDDPKGKKRKKSSNDISTEPGEDDLPVAFGRKE
jgi:hypothetical protein